MNNVMDRSELIVLTQSAIDANRQDQAALDLYWQYIQENAGTACLPGAYQRLYAIRSQQDNPEALSTLVEIAYQRHLADVATLIAMASGEYAAGRDSNALKLYERLLTLRALSAPLYAQLKTICFRVQPFDEVVNLLLHQCLTFAPDDQAIVRFLFSQYLLSPQFTYTPFALPVYQKMLELEPETLTARGLLAECYYRQEKFEEAIAVGEAGLAMAKHHVDLLAVVAKASYHTGEYGRVVTYCRQILARRPGRGDIQVLLAAVYAQNMLTTNEAIKAYRLALNYVPEHLVIRQALVRSYLRKLMFDEALAECEQIVATLNEHYDPDQHDSQSIIKGLIEEYERAIRRAPNDVTLYLITAKLHEYLGHFHQALMYYRTMLEWPLDAELLGKVIEFLEKMTATTVQNPHVYLYLGLLYHKMQRPRDAKRAFQAVMYEDLDEREVEALLIKHDRSIWQYPPVLVILAHHRIVTKDILEGLVHTFQQNDHEDWNGTLWVLQALYDVDDAVAELRQAFGWESFTELAPHIIPIFVQNGSQAAIQALHELLAHPDDQVHFQALESLVQVEHPLAAQYVSQAATDNPYPGIRLEIARFYAQYPSEQTTYQLVNMLHDLDRDIRLCVVQALQQREIQPEPFREALFTEQDPEIRLEIITLLARRNDPHEVQYLARLFNELVQKRRHENSRATGTAKVYHRLKKLMGHEERAEDVQMLSTLIQALGQLAAEQSIYTLIEIASQDASQQLRFAAIRAMAQIGSTLAIPPLETILHSALEPQELRLAAEQALDEIIQRNA